MKLWSGVVLKGHGYFAFSSMLFLREFWKEVDCASPDLTTSCLHCPLAVVVAASGEGLFQNLCTPYVTVASSPTSAILGR